MRNSKRDILELFLAVCLVAIVGASCGGSSTSADVAYEDAYAGDYYYPADVGYAGLYGAGFGYYGIYAVTPGATGLAAPVVALTDAGPVDAAATGAGGSAGHAGATDAGHPAGGAGGGSGAGASGMTTVRGAVGEAIRNIALGSQICPGHATVSRPGGSNVCGLSGAGLMIVFNGCTLSAGGTVDGTVSAQFNLSASDTNCNSATTVSIGYTSTITNLSYTGTGGAKIVIPSQMDMATVHLGLGQTPGSVAMTSSGEIQRLASDGSTSSDRTWTGSRTFSSISILDQTYTVDGMINVTDKAGGTGTISSTGLQRERNCCKPTGGSLSVSRMGGSHAGTHSWMFTSTCGSAMLDGKTVTLPACL
jgi:hypothetical protein